MYGRAACPQAAAKNARHCEEPPRRGGDVAIPYGGADTEFIEKCGVVADKVAFPTMKSPEEPGDCHASVRAGSQ